jgi:hypothetical protein
MKEFRYLFLQYIFSSGNFHLSISSTPIILVEKAALVMFTLILGFDNFDSLQKTSITGAQFKIMLIWQASFFS